MSEFSIEALDAAARGVSGKQSTDQGKKKLFGQETQNIRPELQAQPEGDVSIFDPRVLDQQAQAVAKMPAQSTQGETSGLKKFGQGLAGLADVTVGGIIPSVAGAATYAGARAIGKTPEQATQLEQQALSYTEKPFGRAFGVTETPGYKGEAVNQLMNYIGQHVNENAETIAKKTGLPVADVQNMMNTLIAGVAPEAGRVIGQEAKMIGGAIKEKLPSVRVEQTPKDTTGTGPAAGSVGAAATPTEATIQAAVSQASPELQQAIAGIPVNKVNVPVLQRHIEADTLPVPVRLTEGQATGDPVIISHEMNRRGQPGNEALVNRLNEQNGQLTENLTAIREQAAPNAFGTKPIEHGESLINAYQDINNVLEKDIGAKYQALRDAAGGQFPVDAPKLLQNVESSLKKQLLTNDAKGLSQFKELQRLAEENAMTFEDFLSLRKNLGNVARTAQDGNVRTAASLMIDELEKLPLSKEAAALKPLADEARTAARNRFQMLKADPAMRAAVEGNVPADKFAQKFVVNGVNKNVQQMIANLGENSAAHDTMKAAIIDHLREKAGVAREGGNFTQAGYNKALTSLDNMKNLDVVMGGNAANQLKTLGNVAGYVQNQPKGSFVNNSNTTVSLLADKAAGLLEATGNVVGGGKFGLPIGTMVRNKAQEVKATRAAQQSLKPGAGVELKNIGKE